MAIRAAREFASTSLMLVGPLAFVQTLLFRPRMLTPYMSGEELVVPMELQTLAAVVVFAVACVLSGRLARHPRFASVVLWGIAMPAASAALVVSVRSLWVPVVVAAVLAASCGVMLRTTLAWHSLGREATLGDYALSTIVSLGASSLLVHGGYMVSATDADGTVVLAVIVMLSGAVAAAALAGGRNNAAPSASSAEEGDGACPATSPGTGRDWLDAARAALPAAPAGLICSLSLGTALADPSVEEAVRSLTPFTVGAMAAVGFLAVLAWRWNARSEEQAGEVILFMTVPCALGVLVSIVLHAAPFSVVYAVVACSNLLFLALLWIDMLYLSERRFSGSSALPVVGLVALLAVFCAGMLVAHLVSPAVYRLAAPCAALAYLMYLVFYFQREQALPAPAVRDAFSVAEGRNSDGSPRSFAELRAEACAAMAADFVLSPKEGEVLPLLVTGLSAAAIGKQLFISHETVKTHKYHIYQKCGVHNFEEMLVLFERYADEAGADGAEG
ncbi:helix-turn-helix transcriptional regulator [Adlercreutzia sp. R25]|uniref:Helix-turn-helix transcriptional regulator n=1 Tax=Adlercreutzia shanghongiae TaxID=3111773 RepID=A0ABU6IYC5_9ACTN|nr:MULTISPECIES: helix-turn-helix transcriptional regulator [unclassified Adlercreutzia]MEC4271845.1 helix-turn-helix transcriptional regulator [Adlercreutzia sp. R25]MEC4294852.1 helix-turn-helix transcriptional regulator [Adlercreutzia sp. R22]